MFYARHRKSGNLGRFTVHAPADYRPKHLDNSVETDSPSRVSVPIFDFMECFD